MVVGERMSRTVVDPASSSVRSGFSSPMIRRLREKGWSFFFFGDCAFFFCFTGVFFVFFCIMLLLNITIKAFRALNQIE